MHRNGAVEPSPRSIRPPYNRRRVTKRFHCELCQKHFGRLEHLQRHERAHTQERPFACDICPSSFTSKDLLIRHGRLSHSRETTEKAQNGKENVDGRDASSPRRDRPMSATLDAHQFQHSQVHESASAVQTLGSHPEQSPLEILSMVTQRATFQDGLAGGSVPSNNGACSIPVEPMSYEDPLAMHMPPHTTAVVDPDILPAPDQADMDYNTFNSLADFLETGPLPSFNFSSLFATEQPLPLFSPQDHNDIPDDGAADQPPVDGSNNEILEDPESFSRFGSRLTSLQPEDPPVDRNQPRPYPDGQQHRPNAKRVSDVSNEDRQFLLHGISKFDTIPPGFRLPTRMALARYIRAYVDGFHEHLPFLHIPTMTVTGCYVEITLAMAAVGAQYCFEAEEGLGLFHAARAIATERIRRRDARIAAAERGPERNSTISPSDHPSSTPSTRARSHSISNHTLNGPLGLPSDQDTASVTASPREDLMQSAQALLILMAMATWAKHKEILREALAIQSVLASIVRDDGLRLAPGYDPPRTWHEWARFESFLRTKFIVFCFFNLHCIVYDIPPLILNSELNMRLPCATGLFKASTAEQWLEESKRVYNRPMEFQDSLRLLFSDSNTSHKQAHSALGNYVLIHAIIQHIFFVRQSARCRFDSQELTADEVAPLDQAVRNWQSSWKQSPEASLDPTDPNGPVSFNSTALLRLAYIRLNMDTGPGRALGTRDPIQIAHALRDTPPIKRTPKLTRALLHSSRALSIPIKIGIRLVAKTQTFIWSIQHSLCSLECALLLGKWLEAISALGPDPTTPVSESEMRILSLVRTVLDETEFRVPIERQRDLPQLARHLNAGVLRVWAAIFKGAQTWAFVECIGNSLDIYADMLEAA